MRVGWADGVETSKYNREFWGPSVQCGVYSRQVYTLYLKSAHWVFLTSHMHARTQAHTQHVSEVMDVFSK